VKIWAEMETDDKPRCPKCGGVVVVIVIQDIDRLSAWAYSARRCPECGCQVGKELDDE
jgi:DNA-directed RNA polymerase subunit RPC12/RpoP